jgi:hypothetical protein
MNVQAQFPAPIVRVLYPQHAQVILTLAIRQRILKYSFMPSSL